MFGIIDRGSVTVMGITLVLFLIALITKGLVHDMLLEAGVLLVSIKLMLMAYKNAQYNLQTHTLLNEIRDEVGQLARRQGGER